MNEEVKAIESIIKPKKRIPKSAFGIGQPVPKSPGRPKETAEVKLIKKAAKEVALRILINHSPRAAQNITKLSSRARSESVQLAASQDTLDRVGIMKEKESSDKETLNITFILNSFKVEK